LILDASYELQVSKIDSKEKMPFSGKISSTRNIAAVEEWKPSSRHPTILRDRADPSTDILLCKRQSRQEDDSQTAEHEFQTPLVDEQPSLTHVETCRRPNENAGYHILDATSKILVVTTEEQDSQICCLVEHTSVLGR
jgi:hypothetical protein